MTDKATFLIRAAIGWMIGAALAVAIGVGAHLTFLPAFSLGVALGGLGVAIFTGMLRG